MKEIQIVLHTLSIKNWKQKAIAWFIIYTVAENSHPFYRGDRWGIGIFNESKAWINTQVHLTTRFFCSRTEYYISSLYRRKQK